ncbi:hypothetical protein ACET3Z_000763 [Daucus carota]
MLNSDLLLTGALSVYQKTWVTYGENYDLGHCVKLFQPTNVLPDSQLVFGDMVRSHFGERLFDVKLMLAYTNLAYGKMKLANVAARFNVDNGGVSYEAAADALVTLKLYHILKIKDGNVNFVNMLLRSVDCLLQQSDSDQKTFKLMKNGLLAHSQESREKAEARSLKQEAEKALKQRLACEDRLVSMDASLKECMQQLCFA